jgi:small conductance mechanosensitive channel
MTLLQITENEGARTFESWISGIWDKISDFVVAYGVKFLMAILVLIIGLWLINRFVRVLNKGFAKKDLDETLRPFIANLIAWTLRILLIVSVASMIGIQTTSFIAVIGAAGLAIGLALQGTLANFAGGFLILVFKPFKAGDLIDAQGYLGVVEEIQIFVTKILTPGNRLVIIPNGILSNGSIKNLTAKGQVRVDLVIGISYDSDIKKARDILVAVMKDQKQVLKDPEPFVGVLELADSSVNLAVRPWCHPDDYWDVYFNTTELGKLALDKNGIVIPFPQHDVHMIPGEK